MFAVCAIAALCLMPLSHAASLDCKGLVEPLAEIDYHLLEGRWALVADSLKILEGGQPIQPIDSISIDFHNRTYTQSNRYGDVCYYSSRNVSLEGSTFDLNVGSVFNLRGAFYRASCPDCVMLGFNVDSPNHKAKELCLFSRRRELDQKELDLFRAQVECMNMPEVVVMDPTKDLCAEQSLSSGSD